MFSFCLEILFPASDTFLLRDFFFLFFLKDTSRWRKETKNPKSFKKKSWFCQTSNKLPNRTTRRSFKWNNPKPNSSSSSSSFSSFFSSSCSLKRKSLVCIRLQSFQTTHTRVQTHVLSSFLNVTYVSLFKDHYLVKVKPH